MEHKRLRTGPSKPGKPEWSVYVARCADGTLYTGIAKDVEARLQKHNAGRGGAYTRSHAPVRLYYREQGFTRSEALRREAGIKSLPRPLKERLAAAAAVLKPIGKCVRLHGPAFIDRPSQKSQNGPSLKPAKR